MKHPAYVISFLVIVPLLTWGGYALNRSINWSFGYEDMVEEKIREMVKKESLNE